MKILIQVSKMEHGITIAEHFGLVKDSNRIVKDYYDSDEYEEQTREYEDLVVIGQYRRNYYNDIDTLDFDILYFELFNGGVVSFSSETSILKKEDIPVKYPFSSLPIEEFIATKSEVFKIPTGHFDINDHAHMLFVENLKVLMPLNCLIGDISQDLLACSYNEDQVRDIWNRGDLNEELDWSLKNSVVSYSTKQFVERYKIINGDLQSHVTQAVFLANGWANTWSECHSDLDSLTEKEKELISKWLNQNGKETGIVST